MSEELPIKRREFLWKMALEDLRSECPTRYPVRVRRCKMAECLATTALKGTGPRRYFVISIDRDRDFQLQIYLLQHEWAHAMDWFTTEDVGPHHGPTWGICFAKCYQATIHDD